MLSLNLNYKGLLKKLSRLALLSFRHHVSNNTVQNKMTLHDSKIARKQENIKHLNITVYLKKRQVLKVQLKKHKI